MSLPRLPTADLCDKYSHDLQIADPIFRDFGGQIEFHGKIATVKLFEDNSLVRKMLGTSGEGRVLVVDGGASTRCALLGDNLATLAVENGWAGLVVYGCIRDSKPISEIPLGVKALNTCPLKSVKRNEGQENVEVRFAGVSFKPGDHVYADSDGIIVSKKALNL